MIQLLSLLKERFGKAKSQRGEIKQTPPWKMVRDFVKHYTSLVFIGDERLVHMITEAPKSAGWEKTRILSLSSSEGLRIRKT